MFGYEGMYLHGQQVLFPVCLELLPALHLLQQRRQSGATGLHAHKLLWTREPHTHTHTQKER